MATKSSLEQISGTAVPQPWLERDEVAVLRDLKSFASRSGDLFEIKTSVIQLLGETNSNRVRNAAALTLVDLGAVDAANDIIDVLRRPEVAKASGTLIYAVDELGASMPLYVLARLLERGSYEARAQALFFFEENRVVQSGEDERQEARRILASLAVSDDPEAAEAGRLALAFLEAPEHRPAM